MIRIKNISYSVSGRQLIKDATATIPTGHKVGIVGRNGTGKTTLFHLIAGKLHLDDGDIEIPKNASIGGISQEVPSNDVSLLNTVLAADKERSDLFNAIETETDPNKIATIHERLADIDAYSAEARASSILNGLGFDTIAQQKPCSEFSGGWRMRVALAATLFSLPDILLLDEPTNYLDLEGTIWLENFLSKYRNTVLVISHDRTLLNKSVNSILHLHDQKLTLYNGNYDTFDNTRRARLAGIAAQAKKQQATKEHLQKFVDRFRAKATKAKQAQSRLKMLNKMEPIVSETETSVSGFNFAPVEELSSPIVSIESAAIGYGDTQVLGNLDLRIEADDRIALLGANGQGKSTISKLLAGKINLQKGRWTKANKLRVGYFAQHQVDELELDQTPLEHLNQHMSDKPISHRRAVLAQGGIGNDIADTSVSKLSGGQKARLSMLLATLHKPHLIILDEPTNHLDIESREALALALTDYNGAVILVSHDPHLINATADRLWLVNNGTVVPFDDDLETYKKQLLSERNASKQGKKQAPAPAPEKKPAKQPKLHNITTLNAAVKTSEERIAKLEDMLSTIETRLADPSYYDADDTSKIDDLSKKHTEVKNALKLAEKLWEQAIENLDNAQS